MKNFIKKISLCLAFAVTGLHAGQQLLQVEQAQIDALQDPIAIDIIKAMQEAININQQAQLINKDFQAQQKALRDTAITSIKALRAKNSALTRPDIAALQQLTIDENQSKFLFQRLLDEYLVHLGQVYEKKSGIFGLYRNVVYIASANDQNLSITPNEYLALLQTLENAAQQKDWGTISLNLLVQQENSAVVEKSLTLHDIIGAIKQIPLPPNYYATATKVAAVVAAAAVIGVVAYFASQTFGKDGQLVIPPTLETKVTDIEKKLDVIPVTENATTSTGNIDTPPAAFDATPTESAPNNFQEGPMNSDVTPADSAVISTFDQNVIQNSLQDSQPDLTKASESAPENAPENVGENGGVNPQDALTENNIDAMATEPTNNNKAALAAVGAGALFIASRGKAGRAQMAQSAKIVAGDAAVAVNKIINPKGHQAMEKFITKQTNVATIENKISQLKHNLHKENLHLIPIEEKTKLFAMEKPITEEMYLLQKKALDNNPSGSIYKSLETKDRLKMNIENFKKDIDNKMIELNNAKIEFAAADEVNTKLNPQIRKIFDNLTTHEKAINAEKLSANYNKDLAEAIERKRVANLSKTEMEKRYRASENGPIIHDYDKEMLLEAERINFLESLLKEQRKFL